jgi:hypothetical protein
MVKIGLMTNLSLLGEYEPTEYLPPREAVRRILNHKEIQNVTREEQITKATANVLKYIS